MKRSTMIAATLVLGALGMTGCGAAQTSAIQNSFQNFNAKTVTTSSGNHLLDLGILESTDVGGKCHLFLLPHGENEHLIGICSDGRLTSSTSTIHERTK